MFLTRCPACKTTFRVTREQLLARAGKVRCGSCKHVFDATAHLLEESIPPQTVLVTDLLPSVPAVTPVARGSAVKKIKTPLEQPVPPDPEPVLAPAQVPSEPEDSEVEEISDEAPASVESDEDEVESLSLDELKHQEVEAGLRAPRELAEVPGFSRWSAPALGGSDNLGLAPSLAPRTLWPFVLISLLLVISLGLQGAYHFRGELSRSSPMAAQIFSALNIPVPLARDVKLVSIQTSDLQSANQPNQLVLLATLQNMAPYAQAWPALELTLTNTYDAVLVRKVLLPSDYLAPDASPVFLPGETSIRLQLEAADISPAGYRLYLFYP